MTSIKDLHSGVRRFCTIVDVITKFPKIVTEQINIDDIDSPASTYSFEIDQSIKDVSEEIYAALCSLYKETGLKATSPWVGVIISDRRNNDPTARLRICQAGSNAICEHFTLTFISSTQYTVTGYLSGGVGTGTINADFTSTGGDLIIPAGTYNGLFSGTFEQGDKIYISVNMWHRTIATIATYLATGDAIRKIRFMEGVGIGPEVYERFSNHGKRILNNLRDEIYALDTLPDRDFSDIQLGDWDDTYDKLGRPIDDYFQDKDLENYED